MGVRSGGDMRFLSGHRIYTYVFWCVSGTRDQPPPAVCVCVCSLHRQGEQMPTGITVRALPHRQITQSHPSIVFSGEDTLRLPACVGGGALTRCCHTRPHVENNVTRRNTKISVYRGWKRTLMTNWGFLLYVILTTSSRAIHRSYHLDTLGHPLGKTCVAASVSVCAAVYYF